MAIPTRYINAGPLAAKASAGPAMAAGEATEQIGQALQNVGANGLEIATRRRQIEEGGKINGFMAQADEAASKFSIELARRSDTETWPTEWKNKSSEIQTNARNLELSPEGQANLTGELTNWSINRAIHFETQAATKALGIAKRQTTQSLEYYAGRVDKEGFDRTLSTARDSGILDPAEEEDAQRQFEKQASAADLQALVDGNPRGVLDTPDERILEVLPGATLNSVSHAKRQAEALIQKKRADEMDSLNGLIETGALNPVDIEAAEFLTDRDRHALATALEQKDPPKNEAHAKAWWALGELRELRGNPSITPDQYRTAWNEARGAVLSLVAPRWQGDLRQEISNLSPAGRSTDSGKIVTAYEKGDLEAQGRDVAFRARDAGFFGSVADDAPAAEREKAFRRAEDVRIAVKRFVAGKPDATPEAVREFTDGLISGDRVKTSARELQTFVPGGAQRLRPAPAMPALPPKTGTKDKATSDPLQIPAGSATASDALLPPLQQLENFLK